jgi:hypothetical protein
MTINRLLALNKISALAIEKSKKRVILYNISVIYILAKAYWEKELAFLS